MECVPFPSKALRGTELGNDEGSLLNGETAPAVGASTDEAVAFELVEDFGQALVSDAEETSKILLAPWHSFIEGFQDAFGKWLGARRRRWSLLDVESDGLIVGVERHDTAPGVVPESYLRSGCARDPILAVGIRNVATGSRYWSTTVMRRCGHHASG